MPRSLRMKPISCYCTDDYGCDQNETCVTKPGAQCFHFAEKFYNDETKEVDERHSYGCLPPEEGGSLFQVKMIYILILIRKFRLNWFRNFVRLK